MAAGPNVQPVSPFSQDEGGQTEVVTVEHNGEVFDVEVPKGASDDQVQAFVQQQSGGDAKAPEQGQFGDQGGPQVAGQMAPEDEAHITELLRQGRDDDAVRYARERHFTLGNLSAIQQARDKNGKVSDGAVYELAKPVGPTTAADAFGRGVTNGATLGFGDELHGLAAGAASAVQGNGFSGAYNDAVNDYRATDVAEGDEHGVAHLAGELAGGIAVPVGLERAGITASTRAVGAAARDAAIAEGIAPAAADRIAARAITHRLAIEGAAYGGAYGAGTADGSPGERLLAGATGAAGVAVLGGVGVPLINKAGGAVKRGVNAAFGAAADAVGAVTAAGAQDRAGGLLRDAALRPVEDIITDIAAREAPISGASPTLAETAGDAGLAGFQRGFANTDTRAGAVIGERNAGNALTRTNAVTSSLNEGTPQAIQDYAVSQMSAAEAETAAQQASRRTGVEMRLANNQSEATAARAAAETNLAASRTAIGEDVDRTATASTARDTYGPAYDAAKQRTRDAYSHEELTKPRPLDIPSSFFKDTLQKAADRFYGDGGGEMPAAMQSIISDLADAPTTTRTLTNIDRRLADFAGSARMSGRGQEAGFADTVRRELVSVGEAKAPQTYRDALKQAKAVRAEQGRVFETGDAPRAFAKDRYGNPVVGDTALPGRLVRPGAPGGDTADGLIAAIGQEPAESIFRQELRRVADEGAVHTEAQARSLATRYGEAAKRFPALQADLDRMVGHAGRLDATRAAETAASRAKPTPAEVTAMGERSALHDRLAASPLAKAADAAVDPSSFIDSLLRRSDDGRQLRFLAKQVGGDQAAIGGFRRALGDYIESAGAGPNSTAGGDRIPSINATRTAIATVVGRASSVLTEQQKMVLKGVSRELTAANFAVTASKPAGSETAMNKALAKMIGALPLGPHAGVAKSVLSKVVSALSNEAEVKRLLTQAVLDPDFAITLLKRPTEKHLLDASERIAGRKGIAFVANSASSAPQAAAQRMTGTNQ